MRLRLHSLNVQYAPWKTLFTVTKKITDTITFTQIVATLIFIRNRLMDLIPENVDITEFSPILYSEPLRKYIKPTLKIGDSSHLRAWFTFQEGVLATVYTGSFWNCYNCFHKSTTIHRKRITVYVAKFIKKSWAVIRQWNRLHQSVVPMNLHNYLQTISAAF